MRGRLLCLIPLYVVAQIGTARHALADTPRAVPVQGERFDAELSRIDEDWHVTLDAGERRVVLNSADLAFWGEYRERVAAPFALLTDGSMIVADDELKIGGESISLQSRQIWDATDIPIEYVRSIIYRPPVDALKRDKLLQRVIETAADEDQVWLRNGDVISGTLLGQDSRDEGKGTVWLQIESAGQSLQLAEDNVVAIVFNTALARTSPSLKKWAWIGLRDGSLLRVAQVSPKINRLSLELAGGIRLESYPDFSDDEAWELITFLQPRSNRISYLSDIDPVGYRFVPFLGSTWPYQRDLSVVGGRLRSSDTISPKGLGVHSTSRLAYALNGKYRRFETTVAIDDSAGKQGSVQIRIYKSGDDGEWNRIYESPIIRGGQAPIPISLETTGARGLAIIVDFADYGDTLDRANLLNARLIR